MPSNETIITNAKNRWKCNTDTECLINEVRLLLDEIEVYRECLQGVRLLLDVTVNTLRKEGGE